MRQHIASVSRRGQMTIPAKVRRHLALACPGKVAFVLNDDGTVRLRRALTVADMAGSIPPLTHGASVDFDAEIAEAMEEMADREMAKLRQQ